MSRLGTQGNGAVLSAALNVCTGRETSVLDLVHALGEACGRPATIVHSSPRPGDIRRSVGSPDLAMATLSVQARVPLHEGLAATLRELALASTAKSRPLAPRALV